MVNTYIKQMKTSSAKAKGRRLQQDVVKLILQHFQELEPDDVTSRSMGCGGEDILLSPKARKLLPISIECKNTEKINIWAAWKQCVANSTSGETLYPWDSILIIKRNKEQPIVVMDLDTFFDNYRKYNTYVKNKKTKDAEKAESNS